MISLEVLLNLLTNEYKTICIAIIAGLLLYLWMLRKSSRFPPGPTGLPLVGYTPFISKNAAQTFVKLSKKYGPVFSVHLGRQNYVVINKYDILHEAFVKKSEAYSGRLPTYVFGLFSSETSLISEDYGPKWKSYRKFSVTVLKGFGMGKKSMEGKIAEELEYFCDLLQSKNGKAFNIANELMNAVSNIICSITVGQRFDYNDEKFKRLMFLLNRRYGSKLDSQLTKLMNMDIRLRFLPVFRDVLKRTMHHLSTLNGKTDDFIYVTTGTLKNLVKEHKQTFDESNIRDVIDAYLLEIERNGEYFTEEGISAFILDFFVAGTETTSTFLKWCLLYFAKNHGFQEKLYQEIHSVFGDSGIPSMEKQIETPLTCSFIQEIHRHRTVIRMFTHKTTEDTELMGYKIPKDTPILPNLYAVHHEPDTFRDPDVFNPDRFLNDKGIFCKHPHVIPFSIGPRYCVATKLAEMETYMFLIGIVQKFMIVRDSDASDLPSFEESIPGQMSGPLPYKIRLMKR